MPNQNRRPPNSLAELRERVFEDMETQNNTLYGIQPGAGVDVTPVNDAAQSANQSEWLDALRYSVNEGIQAMADDIATQQLLHGEARVEVRAEAEGTSPEYDAEVRDAVNYLIMRAMGRNGFSYQNAREEVNQRISQEAPLISREMYNQLLSAYNNMPPSRPVPRNYYTTMNFETMEQMAERQAEKRRLEAERQKQELERAKEYVASLHVNDILAVVESKRVRVNTLRKLLRQLDQLLKTCENGEAVSRSFHLLPLRQMMKDLRRFKKESNFKLSLAEILEGP